MIRSNKAATRNGCAKTGHPKEKREDNSNLIINLISRLPLNFLILLIFHIFITVQAQQNVLRVLNNLCKRTLTFGVFAFPYVCRLISLVLCHHQGADQVTNPKKSKTFVKEETRIKHKVNI